MNENTSESVMSNGARALFRQRILIVEDDLEMAGTMQVILELHGFQVTMLDKDSFNSFVSSDVREPNLLVFNIDLMKGFDASLCRKFLERYPNCEMVLVTGAVDPPNPDLVRVGCHVPVILHKPFSLVKFAELAVAMTAY